MQLNQKQREAIRKAAVKKVYAEQYDALRDEMCTTVSRVYRETFATEIKQAKKLPPDWVNSSSKVTLCIKDSEQRPILVRREYSARIDPAEVNRRDDHQDLDQRYPCKHCYGIPSFTVDHGSEHANAIHDVLRRQRALIKEIDRFNDEVTSVLASCRTHKQLEAAAPDLFALIPPELVTKPRQAVVATETVEAVSAKLREAAS